MAASGLLLRPVSLERFALANSRHEVGTIVSGEKLIWIFLEMVGAQGQPFSVEFLSSDAIVSVKIRVLSQAGFYDNQQRLAYGKRELTQGERLIKKCGLSNIEGHLELGASDLVAITVNTLDGVSHVFHVQRTGGAVNAECVLQREGDFLVKSQQLQDGNAIQDLSLQRDCVLHVLAQKPAIRRTKRVGRELEILITACDTASSYGCTPCIYNLTATVDRDIGSVPLIWPQKIVEKNDHYREAGIREDVVGHYSSVELARHHLRFDIPVTLRDLLDQVKTGLQAGHSPFLSSEGSGGVYFMREESGLRNVAVFKPMDEEPLAVNNPRGFSSFSCWEGLKKGTRVGEGAIREVAAYLLDYPASGHKYWNRKDEGFAGVPPTVMVRCYHEVFDCSTNHQKLYRKAKVGSLQEFIPAFSSCEDMGTSSFPIEEVHKISVLDLRLANADRNGGNILVCKGENESVKLVPIDHGYCLPEKFEDCTFEWLYWSQACHSYGPSTLKYIASLDAEEDIALLQQCGWNLHPKIARVLRVSTMVLQKGAAAGLTPFEIGSIMSRDFPDQKSPIEILLEEAETRKQPGASEGDFLRVLSGLLDQYIHSDK
eukprot:c26092_g1_i1 orf=845-2641(+)